MVTPILIVMRLVDMARVHPHQITGHCARCGHEVGIFPSGQQAMREHLGIEVVCHRCKLPGPEAVLVPAAAAEPFETHRKQ
jgi:hypothetical protein